MRRNLRFWLRNLTGAYADTAILLPLTVALAATTDLEVSHLLASAGLAYLAAAWLFRMPMAVQPLKSLAAAAVAAGATGAEVRWAGAAVGLSALLLLAMRADRLALHLPEPFVHGIQVGLGAVLVAQTWHGDWLPAVGSWLLAGAMIAVGARWRLPAIGLVAIAALGWALVQPGPEVTRVPVHASPAWTAVRWWLVGSLVVPQVALTFANSIVSPVHVAPRLFPGQAQRVTSVRLLLSVGVGNLVSALVAGLPFCHGAGGLTAHARGGSSHWVSNALIGIPLLGAAALFAGRPGHDAAHLLIPAWLIGALLCSVGVYHLRLASSTWRQSGGRARLLLVGAVGLGTQNMTVVLGTCVAIEAVAFCARMAARTGRVDDLA